MFSSNPFPSSSSNYTPYFPLLNSDVENAFANNTVFYEPFMPTTQLPIPQTALTNFSTVAAENYNYSLLQKGLEGNYNDDGANSNSNFLQSNKKKLPAAAAKKDRHSKIYTSQGLRDRRVRLSSEIARKFFDLQDMLEFDKPSNTLEWLFTKSENAIQELIISRSKAQQGGVVEADSNADKFSLKEGKKMLIQAKKDSREKARARARTRGSNSSSSNSKINMMMMMEERLIANADPQILQQYLMPPPLHYPNYILGSEVPLPPTEGFDRIIEESIAVLKMNLKKPSNLLASNIDISKESSCFNSYNSDHYHSCSNSPQNWDSTEGGVLISGSSSNHMNLSTSKELQISGKFGEEYYCTNELALTTQQC